MTTLQQLSSSQSSPEFPINENSETLSAAAIYGKRHPVTAGLTWGYYGGLYAGNTVADGTVTLTNNADNYVVVLRSSGVVSTSTTSVNSLNTAYAKLYKLTTLSGVVTVAVDQRMDGNGVLMSGVGVGGAGTVTNTAGVLTASALMVGNAAADAKVLASLGTTTTVLHGNAAGLPTFGAVSLTADVTGVLPIANIATGAPTGSKFVRDDGVLAVPAGSGSVTSVAASVPAFLSVAGSPITTAGTLAITYSGTALSVANGGTGATSLTAYAPVFGGTTSTGAVQSGTVGTAGQVLTSNGAGAVPTFQAAGSGFTGGTLTSALNEAPIVTIASGASVTIGAAAANTITISGTTAITSFDTIASGAVRNVVFAGILTLTHNATSLILPTAANITTAAGDVAGFVSLGAGNWRCAFYQRSSGLAVGSGSGLTNFTDSLVTAAPYSTTSAAIALIATNVAATNLDIVISTKGSGAILGQVADGVATGGAQRGANSVDFQKVRSNSSMVASGPRAFVGAGQSNKASSTNSFVGAGDTNSNSGPSSGIVAGSSNTIIGTNSFIGAGQSNSASGDQAAISGGLSNTASGGYSAICGGDTNLASGNWSQIPGGYSNIASGAYSMASGQFASTRGVLGARAHAASRFGATGDAQFGRYVLRKQTSNATTASATTNDLGAGTTNQPVLPSDSAMMFSALVVARQNTTGDTKSWTITGAIRNTAGTVSLVGTPTVTATGADAGAAAWTIAAVADNTNKALGISVTGEAAKTINWVIVVQTAEEVG